MLLHVSEVAFQNVSQRILQVSRAMAEDSDEVSDVFASWLDEAVSVGENEASPTPVQASTGSRIPMEPVPKRARVMEPHVEDGMGQCESETTFGKYGMSGCRKEGEMFIASTCTGLGTHTYACQERLGSDAPPESRKETPNEIQSCFALLRSSATLGELKQCRQPKKWVVSYAASLY